MRIKEIQVKEFHVPLKTPFKIAYSTDVEHHGILVKITTDTGLEGFGESAPSKHVTGETHSTVKKVIEEIFTPILLGENPFDIGKIMAKLDDTIKGNTSAKCAIDMALYDIKGKALRLPVCDLLGKFHKSILTSVTIGIKSIKDTIKEAHEIVREGYKVLKIKIGLAPEEDIEKISQLRKEFNDVIIRVDANQGYDLRTAIKVANELARYNVEFIEQPLKAWDIKGLRELKKVSPIPIMVDETVLSPLDALHVIEEEACDFINIKLMKSGGIFNAKKIADIAAGAGIKCMIGCMVETRLGVAAGVHFALSTENVCYADLDGHLILKENIVEDGFKTVNGEHYSLTRSGLGVNIRNL